MRNHSFFSLSTAYEHELDHLDDEFDPNQSISSLAKLNRRKPQVSTILKLNLIVVLVISLFIKVTVVTVINGSLSAFIALKLLTHGLILFTFLKKHYISLQLLFVLDVILFVIFLLFEFLLLVSNFAIVIVQHKRNKNLGFINIWLMILIAAIDLLILVMVAIVLENYRKPRERLQQLESKLVTVVHNGRILASQMCKSGSYLLGFVCNSSTSTNQTSSNHQSATVTNNNGLLQNGTPCIYRDSENPSHRISCLDTQEGASSFSLNDDEYVHYSSVDLTNEYGNRMHSFSDFYNFNNRNANQRSNESNIETALNSMSRSNVQTTTSSSFFNNSSTITSSPNVAIINPTNLSTNLSINVSTDASTSTTTTLSSIPTTTLIQNSNDLNNLDNLTNSVTTTGFPSLTTLATSSTFGTFCTSLQQRQQRQQRQLANQTKEQNKSLLERINSIKTTQPSSNNSNLSLNASSISSISNTTSQFNRLMSSTATDAIPSSHTSNTNENENTYVHMYQSNVDEDGDPIDGPLHCTRATIINGTDNESSISNNSSTANTIIQMNRDTARRAALSLKSDLNNCKPVYI